MADVWLVPWGGSTNVFLYDPAPFAPQCPLPPVQVLLYGLVSVVAAREPDYVQPVRKINGFGHMCLTLYFLRFVIKSRLFSFWFLPACNVLPTLTFSLQKRVYSYVVFLLDEASSDELD